MQRGTTPCTAITFVRNGGITFKNCLESCLFCSEHIVLDGQSTDNTVSLSKEYGCTVVTQDANFLNADGKIINFSGIANQGIALATHDWILKLDADEYMDAKLEVSVCSFVKKDEPLVVKFLRQARLNDVIFKYACSYPNYQIRLFHKSQIHKFIKTVHEKPHLKKGATTCIALGIQFVPLDSIPNMMKKHSYYVQLELDNFNKNKSWAAWFYLLFTKMRAIMYLTVKMFYLRCRYPAHQCLPIKYEFLNIRYAFLIIMYTFPLLNHTQNDH